MAENELTLRILSPDGQVLEANHLQEVVVLLADGGPIGIRPKHAPLIAETEAGRIKIVKQNDSAEIDLFPGLLTVRDNIVTILTTGEVEETDVQPDASSGAIDQLTQALEEKPKSDEEVE